LNQAGITPQIQMILMGGAVLVYAVVGIIRRKIRISRLGLVEGDEALYWGCLFGLLGLVILVVGVII